MPTQKDRPSGADSSRQPTVASKTRGAKSGQRRVRVANLATVVKVPNIKRLYAEVDDPKNAGASIFLAAGTYQLSVTDPAGAPRPNGGRLELQPDMKLYGVAGDPTAVTIDTSQLPCESLWLEPNLCSETDPKKRSFATRISSIAVGRGSNAVESLTIIGNQYAAGGIGTDLVDTDTTVRIVDVDFKPAPDVTLTSRGLDIRNLGTAMNGRRIDAVIERCKFHGLDQGIRFVNSEGVVGGKIYAVMNGNESYENKTGCIISNNVASNGRVTVRSSGDQFHGNALGCIVIGGIARADPVTNATRYANANFTRFEAIGSSFVDNRLTGSNIDTGGLVVVGGEAPDNPGGTSDNWVEVRLEDCTVHDPNRPNRDKDFAAYSARNKGTNTKGLAGTYNVVTVQLDGSSASMPVSVSPDLNTNRVVVIREGGRP